jgi:hypothetical protein
MLVSAYGSRWREVTLAMFTAYIDDSGTATEHKVAIASAVLFPAERLVAMEKEWDRFAKKEDVPYFHMSEFAARWRKNEKNKFKDWDDTKADRVYSRLRQIIKKYGAHAISVGVKKSDYNEAIPEDIRKIAGNFHYSWAVRHLLDFLANWRGKTRCKLPLEYVFSWMAPNDKSRTEIEKVMSQAHFASQHVAGHEREFDNWSFRHPEELPGLQCSDVMAWIAYQFSLLIYSQKQMSLEAKKGWRDLYGPTEEPTGFWDAWVIKKGELQKFMEHEAKTGHSKQWYGRWEKFWEEQQSAKQRIPKIRLSYAGDSEGSSRADQKRTRRRKEAEEG